VLPGIGRPPVPVGSDLLQCRRVFICHSARSGGKRLKKRKILNA
jgi:hypothetical protein